MSRLLKIRGLFYKRALSKSLYSAKETYNLKEPTNRSHRIPGAEGSIDDNRLGDAAGVEESVLLV